MSAARTALLGLVATLATAVEPGAVAVDGAEVSGEAAVRVRPTSLARIGRSQREGSVLDLELVASVTSSGPQALERVEEMLTALERQSRYTVQPLAEHHAPAATSAAGDGLDHGARSDGSAGHDLPTTLGFRVRMPVGVRLEEPVRWRVSAPLQLDLRLARSIAGVLLDSEGRGVPDAQVSVAVGGGPSATDAEGRFRLLVADAPQQTFVVEVRGATRTVDAATDTAPVVIRWE